MGDGVGLVSTWSDGPTAEEQIICSCGCGTTLTAEVRIEDALFFTVKGPVPYASDVVTLRVTGRNRVQGLWARLSGKAELSVIMELPQDVAVLRCLLAKVRQPTNA